MPCGLCVGPGLEVGRFGAETGHDGGDLLPVGVAVVQRLDHQDALFGLECSLIQDDQLGRVDGLRDEALPDVGVLVGASL